MKKFGGASSKGWAESDLYGTVEDGQKIDKFFLGEHKVITPEQQLLSIIKCFFKYLKWPWLLHFFAKMP